MTRSSRNGSQSTEQNLEMLENMDGILHMARLSSLPWALGVASRHDVEGPRSSPFG